MLLQPFSSLALVSLAVWRVFGDAAGTLGDHVYGHVTDHVISIFQVSFYKMLPFKSYSQNKQFLIIMNFFASPHAVQDFLKIYSN